MHGNRRLLVKLANVSGTARSVSSLRPASIVRRALYREVLCEEKAIGVKLDDVNFTGEKPDAAKVTPVDLGDVKVTREKPVAMKFTREELDGVKVTDVGPDLAKFTGVYVTGVKLPALTVVVEVAAREVAVLEPGST